MSKTSSKKTVRTECYVEDLGRRVALKKRVDSPFYVAETRFADGRRARASTGHTSLDEARTWAHEWIIQLVREERGGELGIAIDVVERGDALTWRQVFNLFRDRRLPFIRGTHKAALVRCMTYWEGIGLADVVTYRTTQEHIDTYVRRRQALDFTYVGADGTSRRPTRSSRMRTIKGELVLLNTVVRWVAAQPRSDGSPLLPVNPFRTVGLPKAKERRRRHVMSAERFEALTAAANDANGFAHPQGLLTFLRTSRWTGRRAKSVLGLRRRDVFLEQRPLRDAALRLGLGEEVFSVWPEGGLWWDKNFDKKHMDYIAPMSRRLRRALEAYLDMMADKSPDAFLFPLARNPRRPNSTSRVIAMLHEAEDHARAMGYDLPALPWGATHTARRAFRSERRNLFDDELVGLCVGWEPDESHNAMNVAYLQYPLAAWYHCMEYLPSRDREMGHVMLGVNVRVNPDAGEELESQLGHTLVRAAPISVQDNGLRRSA